MWWSRNQSGKVPVVALGSIALGLATLGLSVLGVRLLPSPADDDRSSCGSDGPDLGVYEWRTDHWRETPAYGTTLDRLAGTCVDRVYVDITRAALVDGPEAVALADDLRELGRRADGVGIEIAAVAGDPYWPSEPGLGDTIKVLQFAASMQPPNGPLTSLHLDVEPWGLDEWSSDKEDLVIGYLDYVRETERLRQELDFTIPVGYLLPYWFDSSTDAVPAVRWNGRVATPFDHLLDTVTNDGLLIVMAYRNRAAGEGGIVDLATYEANAAARSISAPAVLVAVESGDIEPEHATFFGAEWPDFVEEMETVADHTGSAEIVVNDAESLLELSRRRDDMAEADTTAGR